MTLEPPLCRRARAAGRVLPPSRGPATRGRFRRSGREARWSRDGKELFFFDRDNRLQVAAVDTSGPRFEVRSIGPLFQTPCRGPVFNWRYDVFPDGKSFLSCTPTDEDAASPLTLVSEWTRKVKG